MFGFDLASVPLQFLRITFTYLAVFVIELGNSTIYKKKPAWSKKSKQGEHLSTSSNLLQHISPRHIILIKLRCDIMGFSWSLANSRKVFQLSYYRDFLCISLKLLCWFIDKNLQKFIHVFGCPLSASIYTAIFHSKAVFIQCSFKICSTQTL